MLELAVAETQRRRSPTDLVVWLVHFPPEAPRLLQLMEEGKLLSAVRRSGVRLVLFGHTHAARMVVTNDYAFITASTATEFDLSNSIRRSFNFYKVSFERTDAELIIEPYEIDTNQSVLGRRPLHARRLVRFPTH